MSLLESFTKGLKILVNDSGHPISEFRLSLYLDHCKDRLDVYLPALRKFYKNNISRPRLPSLEELDEIAFGKKITSSEISALAVAEYINLVRQYGRYEAKAIRELVGEPFFKVMSRVKSYESLCNANEYQVSEFKKEARIALDRDRELNPNTFKDYRFLMVVEATTRPEEMGENVTALSLLLPPQPPPTVVEEELYAPLPEPKKLSAEEIRSGINNILKDMRRLPQKDHISGPLTEYLKVAQNLD